MNLKIFTEKIEQQALDQIYRLMSQPVFAKSKVRIMPDVHAGAGCVVGFTADLGEKVIPNIVGVDIGCGMLTVPLYEKAINLKKLDKIIRGYVPHGSYVHTTPSCEAIDLVDKLICKTHLKNHERLFKSMGTLGGGNHFIEIAKDSKENLYLIIHTGSRNLGKQVAEHYQKLAIKNIKSSTEFGERRDKLIQDYKGLNRQRELKEALTNFDKANKITIPKDLCYLTGELKSNYLYDMAVCQLFATRNRLSIKQIICNAMGFAIPNFGVFETVHNYISSRDNIIRKGAIAAYKEDKVLIPINMRDGSILALGKGNEDWNFSAPHGAGRIMSRTEAKNKLNLRDYEKTMENIFTTSVGYDTIDEAPMAYKSIDDIVENISDTVQIIDILKPIYNFKSSE